MAQTLLLRQSSSKVCAALWPEAGLLNQAALIFGPEVMSYSAVRNTFNIRVGASEQYLDTKQMQRVAHALAVLDDTALARRAVYLACAVNIPDLQSLIAERDSDDEMRLITYARKLHNHVPDIDEQLAQIATASHQPMRHGVTAQYHQTSTLTQHGSHAAALPAYIGRDGGICTHAVTLYHSNEHQPSEPVADRIITANPVVLRSLNVDDLCNPPTVVGSQPKTTGAESLIITDDAVQITAAEPGSAAAETQADADFADTVIAEMLGMLGVTADDCADNDSAEDDSTEDTDDEADEVADDESTNTAVPTAIRGTGDAESKYTIHIEYDSESGVYTDHNTGAVISDETIVDIINCAYETSADVTMVFDIPGHGMTTFIGDLVDGYRGYDGMALVSTAGGAYVLNAEQELTDDMSVLTEARFTFTGDAETIFEELEVNIVDADANSDDDKDDCDSADDDTASQNIRLYCVDDQLYVSIYSRSHNLKNVGIRRIVNYAATYDLSARLLIEGEREPYVGRLQTATKDADADTAQYVFIDKKRGAVQIDLDETDLDAGFSVLEIYSDADMRRRGFAGTNHTEYSEISIVEMHRHLTTILGE